MPQLNPEFFASQLFWLVITFMFLLIFLWRISLPRIGSVLEKRESKINDDIKVAKQLQAEAEEIQLKIDQQLREARLESDQLINKALIRLQDHSNKELEKLDNELEDKINHSTKLINENKDKSIKLIHEQIYDITKLTLSKISDLKVTSDDIKKTVDSIEQKRVH
tara:strand:+ start:1033 stop:1527 length:495 start_codon:yes stop_codon:yes gene_type:complete